MPFSEEIAALQTEFKHAIDSVDRNSPETIENLRIKYLGRKGSVAILFAQLGKADAEERPQLGQLLNQLKQDLTAALDSAQSGRHTGTGAETDEADLSLPGDHFPLGSLHPIEQTLQEVKKIFASIGFSVAYGPEVDDDYHNFEALNIPKHHPARDMQDTFYISHDVVLRTHTSNTQIHIMENQDPPLRVICPGRVFRHEDISVRSFCMFHQVEGLYVNRNVSFAEMKGTLEYFNHQFFGSDVKSRFRPSFFPFTEPSAEVDISCIVCRGKGCSLCKRTGWLEILGCGMVDPNVYGFVGYDAEEWRGYAFGMGIERLAMLKYQIDDIRLFFNGDVRFLRQFV